MTTLNVAFAGEGSTFPAASTARTSKECLPRFTFARFGDVHALNAAPSSRHSKVEPDSSESNSKLTEAFWERVFTLPFGALVMAVFGGTPSGGGAEELKIAETTALPPPLRMHCDSPSQTPPHA